MSKTSYAIVKTGAAGAFVNANFSHKPALVLRDGTLFIVIDKHLYKSDDYGYTWDKKQRDVSGVGATQYMGDIYYFSGQTAANDGDSILCVELTCERDYINGPAVKMEFGGGNTKNTYTGISNSTHARSYFLVDDDVYYDYDALVSAATNTTPSVINQPDGAGYFDSITDGNFAGIFTKAYKTEDTWEINDMMIRDPNNLDTAKHEDKNVDTYDYINRFAAKDRHCLVSSDEATDRIIHLNVVNYNAANITETPIHTLTGTSAKLDCMSLDSDAYNNLCGFFTEISDSANTMKYHYIISKDSGANWTDTDMTASMGGVASYFEGAPVDILGCDDGFMFLYVRKDYVNNPRLFVNKLETLDGITYTLGTPREAASSPSGVAVYGGYFFRPEEDIWYNLDRAGDIRIAYQAGDAIEQELLSETAYPEALSVADSGLNQDFINVADASGTITNKFLNVFDNWGVTCSFHKYVPSASGKMDDKSAFSVAIDSEHIIVIDPETYKFPIPDLSTAETADYIEQDTRKVFLPPNLHLDREYLVNDGNFLKRTVWTMDYDGNSYELSQVVPRFLNDHICYYTSNAYVIGQSRDPWSRTILQSET